MKREKMRFLALLCILIGFSSLLGFIGEASEGSGSTITPLSRRYDISFGAPEAPVEITMYFSPTCHACAHYEKTVLPVIQERFIKKGKVYFVMRLLPFHRSDFAVAKLIWSQKPSSTVHELAQLFLSSQQEWLDPLLQGKKARAKLLKAKIRKVGEALKMSPEELKEKLGIKKSDQDAFLKLFALENGFTFQEILQALQDNPDLEEALTANHIQGEEDFKAPLDHAPAFVINGNPWEGWVKPEDIEKQVNAHS